MAGVVAVAGGGGEGEGGYISRARETEGFTLEEESDREGWPTWHQGTPRPQPPVFTNNRRQFPDTVPS